jgi:hypothetical protein
MKCLTGAPCCKGKSSDSRGVRGCIQARCNLLIGHKRPNRQLATGARHAPLAGVDMKQIAICWLLVERKTDRGRRQRRARGDEKMKPSPRASRRRQSAGERESRRARQEQVAPMSNSAIRLARRARLQRKGASKISWEADTELKNSAGPTRPRRRHSSDGTKEILIQLKQSFAARASSASAQ